MEAEVLAQTRMASCQELAETFSARAGRISFPIPCDADARDIAMIVAAMHGRLTTVRVFLDNGVDVNATPYRRESALHYAAFMGRTDVV